MHCQCPDCGKLAEVGGMLCQPCRDAIDHGNMDHHSNAQSANPPVPEPDDDDLRLDAAAAYRWIDGEGSDGILSPDSAKAYLRRLVAVEAEQVSLSARLAAAEGENARLQVEVERRDRALDGLGWLIADSGLIGKPTPPSV